MLPFRRSLSLFPVERHHARQGQERQDTVEGYAGVGGLGGALGIVGLGVGCGVVVIAAGGGILLPLGRECQRGGDRLAEIIRAVCILPADKCIPLLGGIISGFGHLLAAEHLFLFGLRTVV